MTATASALVGRKKRLIESKQVNIRVPGELLERLEEVAQLLGHDNISVVIRLIIAENIAKYEEKAKRFRGDD